MSFILDALRKVDRENRAVDEVVPPVAAIDRLRAERRRRRRHYAAVIVIASGSAAATALLLRAPTPEKRSSPDSAPPLPVVRQSVEAPLHEEERFLRESKPASPESAPETTVVQEAPPRRETPPIAVPAVEEPPAFPHLVLQGTSVLNGKPVAVVSDRRVFEGDTIEGAVVVRIEERSVTLEFEGREFTLTL